MKENTQLKSSLEVGLVVGALRFLDAIALCRGVLEVFERCLGCLLELFCGLREIAMIWAEREVFSVRSVYSRECLQSGAFTVRSVFLCMSRH